MSPLRPMLLLVCVLIYLVGCGTIGGLGNAPIADTGEPDSPDTDSGPGGGPGGGSDGGKDAAPRPDGSDDGGTACDASDSAAADATADGGGHEDTGTTGSLLDEWSYRKQLVVPRRTPSAELRNFPLLVSLPRDDDLRDRARNDGGDILFALPDGTLLAHETESFAGDTGRLVAWVKIPTLDTSAVTVLYLYYGNGEADIESRSSSVWNDFTGVWHLSETGSGARGEYRDATGNGHNGTGGGGVGRAVPTSAPGIVGQGQSGDGVDDIITTSASINGLGQVTISLWARLRRVDNIHRPGLAGQNDAIEIGFYWSDRLNMWTEGMTTPCPGKQVASLCTDVPTMEEWFHLAVTWDGSDATMYVNGVEEHSLGALPRSSVYTFNLMGAVFDPSGNHLDGLLDEVRLADTVRSAAWVAHEYANQVAPTSFCQVGEEESL